MTDNKPDFCDLLRALNSANARYLVVGAHVVGYHAELARQMTTRFLDPYSRGPAALRRGLIAAFTLLPYACSAPSAVSMRQITEDGHALSPTALLRRAGGIVCDAETFEAVGRMVVRSPQWNENVPIRWVFGPRGEYRFERGPVTVVFDSRRLAIVRACQYRALDYSANPRGGPHHRYAGDMLMATGMVAIGMTYPEVSARLWGAEGMDELLSSDVVLERVADEQICGQPCIKLLARIPERPGKMAFWVDKRLGVVRKWRTGDGHDFMSVEYQRIRVNPRINSRKFKVPSGAKVAPEGWTWYEASDESTRASAEDVKQTRPQQTRNQDGSEIVE